MFSIWTDDDRLGAVEKVRVPQRFGIGVAYVGKDALFPSDIERQRATEISKQKGVVSQATRWQTCASIDSVTGECASFTVGQDAQPLPSWVTTGGLPPAGIIPTPAIPSTPSTPSEPVAPGPAQPAPAPTSCPAGSRLVGWTQSIPGSPICEPSGGDGDGGDGTIVPGPTQTTPGGKQVRQRYRERVVELCPLSGFVTRPIQGADEYQVFRCTPGQRVTIDRGLQQAGIREAAQRREMSGQPVDAVDVSSTVSGPNWLLLGGIAIGAYLLLGGKRGR